MGIFIVMCQEYLAPIVLSYENCLLFYSVTTNIFNNICTILKQTHYKFSCNLVWSLMVYYGSSRLVSGILHDDIQLLMIIHKWFVPKV